MPRTHLLLAAALCTVLSGCGGGDKAKVSESELNSVKQASEKVSVGMSKTDALAAFKSGNKTKLSSTTIAGAAIEEWKVEAFYDDDWKKSRSMFVSFLYFMNDKLVDTSDKRLDYRSNPTLVNHWREAAGK
jgi:hypothetical protein